jgi:hypothetical protein
MLPSGCHATEYDSLIHTPNGQRARPSASKQGKHDLRLETRWPLGLCQSELVEKIVVVRGSTSKLTAGRGAINHEYPVVAPSFA